MFKKFLYGTLFAALITVVAVGGFVGVTLFQIQNLVKQVQDLSAQYQQTNKDFSKDDPTGAAAGDANALDPGRVAKYLEIRQKVGEKLDDNLVEIRNELKAKDAALGAASGGQPGRLGFLEMMDLIRSQFQRLDAVGREHVEQLRAARMAAGEYRRLTHHLLGALAMAGDDEAPDSMAPLRGAWDAYEEPADTVNSLMSRSRGGREQKLDVDELRQRLLRDEENTSAPIHMAEILLRRAPVGGGSDAAWLQSRGTPLLDLLVDQYDPAALMEQ